eukprot:1782710-Rhodomonas_salina.1
MIPATSPQFIPFGTATSMVPFTSHVTGGRDYCCAKRVVKTALGRTWAVCRSKPSQIEKDQ